MAIYKSSLHSPNLEEVDIELEQGNTFSCVVNTSGEPILAYKMQILSGRGDKTIYSPSEPTSLPKPIKNKNILKMAGIGSRTIPELKNGQDYQWGVRVYNQEKNATTQPNTLVCEGFLVGSTKNVIWCKIPKQTEDNKDLVDQIVYDRYIEFNVNSSQMCKSAKDEASKKIPDTLRERRKIDWVTKELGYNKNVVKIETTEEFSFNFLDGTSFTIFQCSDEHTLKSFFVDPNSNINVANYIVLFNNAEAAKAAHDSGYKPSLVVAGGTDPSNDTVKHTADNMFGTPQKIVGYSSDTGEVRLGQSYPTEPTNGQAYLIFEYDSVSKVFNELTPNVGDDATEAIKNNPYITQVVGGQAITNALYKVLSNKWDSESQRLFIQPNTNIKSDETNPNEIVFANGTRIDIEKQYWKNEGVEVDITFDKLDNTQWLLTTDSEGLNESGKIPKVAVHNITSTTYTTNRNEFGGTTYDIEGISVPILPQTDYKIYTDFMDSMPYNIFYARKTPDLSIFYRDLNRQDEEFRAFDDGAIDLRNIEFNTLYNALNGQAVKYYHYYLYAYKDYVPQLIAESADLYSSDLIWAYRGFSRDTKYNIRIVVVDEYGKEFSHDQDFNVVYNTEKASSPLKVEFDCDKKAIKITASSPEYVIPSLPNVTYIPLAEEKIQVQTDEVGSYVEFVENEETKKVYLQQNCIYYLIDSGSSEGIYREWNGQSFGEPSLLPVTINNVHEYFDKWDDYIEITSNNQLYYDTVLDDNYPNTKIQIPNNFSFLSQFQITREFVEQIPLTTSSKKLGITGVGYEYFDPTEYQLELEEVEKIEDIAAPETKKIYKLENGGYYIWNSTKSAFDNVLVETVGDISKTVFLEGEYYFFEEDREYDNVFYPQGYYLWGNGYNNKSKQLYLFLNNCQSIGYEGEEIVKNPRRACLELYEEENPAPDTLPISCFVVGQDANGADIISDHINLLTLNTLIPTPQKYKYAIQDNTKGEYWFSTNLRDKPRFTNTNVPAGSSKKEVYRLYDLERERIAELLQQGQKMPYVDENNNPYGVYTWDGYDTWNLDTTDYVFINHIDDLVGYGIKDEQGKSYDEMTQEEKFNYLSVPTWCRNEETGELKWTDSDEKGIPYDYVWVDNSAYSYQQLVDTIEKIWLSMYLTVTHGKSISIKCIIEAQEKWEG